MATRDITAQYFEARELFKGFNQRPSFNELSTTVTMLAPSAPVWAEVVEAINLDITNIGSKLDNLSKLHTERLKVTFGNNEDEQDQRIELLTKDITMLFKRCENNVKRIAVQGIDSTTTLSPEEQSMRLNAMRGMAAKIRSQSQRFRASQKDFLMRMKKREDFPIEIGDHPSEDGTIPLDEIMEKGFTPAQMEEIEKIRREGAEREQQIVQIAKSINELAQMFKELSVLIVEQGSIIDRIDYNIEQARSTVSEGLNQVRLTKQEQDKGTNRAWFCMIALFIGIIVCVIMMAIKYGK